MIIANAGVAITGYQELRSRANAQRVSVATGRKGIAMSEQSNEERIRRAVAVANELVEVGSEAELTYRLKWELVFSALMAQEQQTSSEQEDNSDGK